MPESWRQAIRDLPFHPLWNGLIEKAVPFLAAMAATLGVFIVGQWLIRVVVTRVFRPLIERERAVDSPRVTRLVTLEILARSVLLYTLYFIVFGIFLTAIGQNIGTLLATAGVAGVAVGFGAQKFVRDVVTGFLLLLEDQFAVGDLVTIGSNTGIVEEMGMRITRLRDESGRLIILSNGDIVSVVNFSKGGFRVGIDIAVSPDADLEAVREAVAVAGERLRTGGRNDALPTYRGITAMSAASSVIRVEAVVPPADRLEAETRIRGAIREALVEREIRLA